MNWFDLSAKADTGMCVVFTKDWDIFPECLVPAGTTGTVEENGLNEIWCCLTVRPDDPALQAALKDWNGLIHLSPPLDRETGGREFDWQGQAPLLLR